MQHSLSLLKVSLLGSSKNPFGWFKMGARAAPSQAGPGGVRGQQGQLAFQANWCQGGSVLVFLAAGILHPGEFELRGL